MKRRDYGLEVQVALAIIGFFLGGGLSLGVGNGVVTSIERGAVGLFGFFLIGYLLRLMLRFFVGQSNQMEELRGQHIDLLLTDPSAEDSQAPAAGAEEEFVPLSDALRKTSVDRFQDSDPQMLAEALRHLEE